MFFNITQGKDESATHYPNDVMVWRTDSHIFWSSGGVEFSILLTDYECEKFCKLLETAASNKEYVDLSLPDGLYIALEDEDEGTRNLCLRDKRLYNILNLEVRHFNKFVEFLRNEIKKNKTKVSNDLMEKMMDKSHPIHDEFTQFMELMKQTTDNLKKMSSIQNDMRYQFGHPQIFEDFVEALNDTQHGWVSSNC